jgi:FkbM family methyltransferase
MNSIRLDTFVKNNNIGHIDFLWLDCQGAEDIVIEGGRLGKYCYWNMDKTILEALNLTEKLI